MRELKNVKHERNQLPIMYSNSKIDYQTNNLKFPLKIPNLRKKLKLISSLIFKKYQVKCRLKKICFKSLFPK